jgi:hypothetical protein
LLKEEERGKDTAPPESFSDYDDEESTDSGGEGYGDSSDDGSGGDQTSEHEEDSSKVDITG